MKLSCALVACNDNPHYLQFWPIVKKAWWDIVGIPCIMIYVAETIPNSLKTDSAVIHFQPIQGWPTATQAQVIRLLYPALLKGSGAIVLSDMDILPMQRNFFHKGFEPFEENQIVSLRGIDEQEKQIYMCYVGATPQTWQDLFGIHTPNDIRARLEEWSRQTPADGQHGGQGWCTDQEILYQVVKGWQNTQPARVGLLPWTPTISRLDRGNPYEWIEPTKELDRCIEDAFYIDFHMPPYEPFRPRIDAIVEKACLQNPANIHMQ
jgi:hypothetical protein